MFIENQDNKTMVNMKNVTKIYIEDKYLDRDVVVFAFLSDCTKIELGQYNNLDRAIEVRDEIFNKYIDIQRSCFLGMEEASFIKPIYSMPQE